MKKLLDEDEDFPEPRGLFESCIQLGQSVICWHSGGALISAFIVVADLEVALEVEPK